MKEVAVTKEGVQIFVDGEQDGGQGIVQFVVPEVRVQSFVNAVEAMGLRLYAIPVESDIPTYGIGPSDEVIAAAGLTKPDLMDRFPEINWAEPQPVTIVGGETGFVCRICVSLKGFKAKDGPHFKTDEEGRAHIAAEHPEYVL